MPGVCHVSPQFANSCSLQAVALHTNLVPFFIENMQRPVSMNLLPLSFMTHLAGCRFVNTVLTWLINPIVLGSIIVFIAFWLIIARGKLKRYYRESTKLKEEFDKYRREMQVKVQRRKLL